MRQKCWLFIGILSLLFLLLLFLQIMFCFSIIKNYIFPKNADMLRLNRPKYSCLGKKKLVRRLGTISIWVQP